MNAGHTFSPAVDIEHTAGRQPTMTQQNLRIRIEIAIAPLIPVYLVRVVLVVPTPWRPASILAGPALVSSARVKSKTPLK